MEEFMRDRRWAMRHQVDLKLKHRIWKSSMPEQSAQAVDISEQVVSDCRYSSIRTIPVSRWESGAVCAFVKPEV